MLKSLIEERVVELKGCGANKPGGGGFAAGNTCARGGSDGGLDSSKTDRTYAVYVDGEKRGRVWYAPGANNGAGAWGALIRPGSKAVPRSTPKNTLDDLRDRVAKDFKGKKVEFRLED